MISTCNIFSDEKNPLCVAAQRSAGFFYFATVKLGIINVEMKNVNLLILKSVPPLAYS